MLLIIHHESWVECIQGAESSNKNKRAFDGRMVIFPFFKAKGGPYCFSSFFDGLTFAKPQLELG